METRFRLQHELWREWEKYDADWWDFCNLLVQNIIEDEDYIEQDEYESPDKDNAINISIKDHLILSIVKEDDEIQS